MFMQINEFAMRSDCGCMLSLPSRTCNTNGNSTESHISNLTFHVSTGLGSAFCLPFFCYRSTSNTFSRYLDVLVTSLSWSCPPLHTTPCSIHKRLLSACGHNFHCIVFAFRLLDSLTTEWQPRRCAYASRSRLLCCATVVHLLNIGGGQAVRALGRMSRSKVIPQCFPGSSIKLQIRTQDKSRQILGKNAGGRSWNDRQHWATTLSADNLNHFTSSALWNYESTFYLDVACLRC